MRESEVAQSCLTVCDPMDCSLPGSSVHGISRQEYWSGLPLPNCYSIILLFLSYLTFITLEFDNVRHIIILKFFLLWVPDSFLYIQFVIVHMGIWSHPVVIYNFSLFSFMLTCKLAQTFPALRQLLFTLCPFLVIFSFLHSQIPQRSYLYSVCPCSHLHLLSRLYQNTLVGQCWYLHHHLQ